MTLKVMGVNDFPPLHKATTEEIERRRRIQLSVAAYAYEIAGHPVMDDFAFDQLAYRIDKRVMTGHPVMDEFFLFCFSPMTGMWIHDHPELSRIAELFSTYKHWRN